MERSDSILEPLQTARILVGGCSGQSARSLPVSPVAGSEHVALKNESVLRAARLAHERLQVWLVWLFLAQVWRPHCAGARSLCRHTCCTWRLSVARMFSYRLLFERDYLLLKSECLGLGPLAHRLYFSLPHPTPTPVAAVLFVIHFIF